jgi:hypothetical protein
MTVTPWWMVWFEHNWGYLLLGVIFFGSSVAATCGSVFDRVSNAVRARRKHRIHMKKLELEIAQAHTDHHLYSGRCRHRNVTQVRDRNDELVAWPCKDCDTELPADWSVVRED